MGPITKMGQRDIRRLLYLGATAVIASTIRRGKVHTDPWLARMLDEKPRKVVAVALANRMARIIWAVTGQGGELQGRGEPGRPLHPTHRVSASQIRGAKKCWLELGPATHRRIERKSSGLEGCSARMGVSWYGPNWRVQAETSDKVGANGRKRRGRNNQ